MQECGLIAAPVTSTFNDRYLIGEQFLQYISFMGCSPAVEFAPDSDRSINWSDFIFIHLPETLREVKWFVDQQTAKPACPHCQKRSRTWLDTWLADENLICCQHCSMLAPVCEWNWFDAGGCTRQFISIVNVYPREAIPSDHFLKLLADISDVEWRYFYVNGPLFS